MNIETGERILAALFLCSSESNEILAELKPIWNQNIQVSLKEKLLIIPARLRHSGGNSSFSIFEVFPWKNELSSGIDHDKFCESFFIQPDLFLRLRPGKEKTVIGKLERAGIQFQLLSDSCVALPNASKIDNNIELDREAVIQDFNSQQIAKFIDLAFALSNDQYRQVWDCCAGSGGKSILAYDVDPGFQLTVSDVRESILANLKKRFLKAGVKKYKSVIIDLAKNNIQHSIINNQFSTIVADVPCSGSGTWSRTPEQLFYFNEKKIEEYASLQKQILSKVIPHLQPGGSLIYITCSVFKKENEEIVDFLKKDFGLRIAKMELLKGYDKKADSMFVAVLQKEL